MSKLTLSLIIHNHQPVGNFDHVFAEATERAYDPMLGALERHPEVRLALHYSGPLLDWLSEHRPNHLDRVRRLATRKQIELLTGAYYEPVLAAIPDVDKSGQIKKMTRYLRERLGYEPKGAWLAERVWEPHLAKTLAEAGVQYTLLDDTPFKMAGLTDDDLFGSYVTEEQGYPLQVFGNVMYLRYALPWHPVEEVMKWLWEQAKSHTGGVAVMGDDGEKFGLWPGTYKHCWEEGWIDRFFETLEESAEWLAVRPPGEVIARQAPLGRVYLPTASYDEMMQWALPPDDSNEFAKLRSEFQQQNRSEVLRFLKGASWRSFLARYDEANQMHKKMLWVSRKVHQMPEGEEKTQALEHVWAAQCNCAYWHGLFGGVYLFHIRAANYANLIAAEHLADQSVSQERRWVRVERGDFDADGREDVILNTDRQVLIFKPSYGGALVEWDWRDRRYNLLNTMTRHREGYHQKLQEAAKQGRLIPPGREELPNSVRVKERDIHTHLFYDWHRRAAFLDHFLHQNTTPETFYQARYGEQGDFVTQPYEAQVDQGEDAATLVLTREGTVWAGEVPIPVRLEKKITVEADSSSIQARYRVLNTGDTPATLRFGAEFNWGIVGGDSKYGYLKIGEETYSLGDFEGSEEVSQLVVGSTLPDLAGEVVLNSSRPAQLWCFPLEVVSNSEAGYERVYQGTCTLLGWEVPLEPELPWSVTLTLELV